MNSGRGGERSLRVAFFVQGEGRGHMTQSLALKRMLEDAGHAVVAVFMGEPRARPVPAFVKDALGALLRTYEPRSSSSTRRGKGSSSGPLSFKPWASFPVIGPHSLTSTAESGRPDLI